MEIILKQDVNNLGYADDLVKVKDGYARNYLIPQGLAELATPAKKKMLAETLNQYDIPVCYDFPASHDEDWNYPMIEGCQATLTVAPEGVTLTFGK